MKIVKKPTVNDQASLQEELPCFLVKRDESTPLDNFKSYLL
ncbi:MAG: hypothetical protein ACLSXY_03305 [Veillonella sp.]